MAALAGRDWKPGDRSFADVREERLDALGDLVEQHLDTRALFDWLASAFSYQGISNQVAYDYMEQHGYVAWRDLEDRLGGGAVSVICHCWQPSVLNDASVGAICTIWAFLLSALSTSLSDRAVRSARPDPTGLTYIRIGVPLTSTSV